MALVPPANVGARRDVGSLSVILPSCCVGKALDLGGFGRTPASRHASAATPAKGTGERPVSPRVQADSFGSSIAVSRSSPTLTTACLAAAAPERGGAHLSRESADLLGRGRSQGGAAPLPESPEASGIKGDDSRMEGVAPTRRAPAAVNADVAPDAGGYLVRPRPRLMWWTDQMMNPGTAEAATAIASAIAR